MDDCSTAWEVAVREKRGMDNLVSFFRIFTAEPARERGSPIPRDNAGTGAGRCGIPGRLLDVLAALQAVSSRMVDKNSEDFRAYLGVCQRLPLVTDSRQRVAYDISSLKVTSRRSCRACQVVSRDVSAWPSADRDYSARQTTRTDRHDIPAPPAGWPPGHVGWDHRPQPPSLFRSRITI